MKAGASSVRSRLVASRFFGSVAQLGEHCACNAAVGVRLPSDPLFLHVGRSSSARAPECGSGETGSIPVDQPRSQRRRVSVPDGLVDLPRLIHEALRGSIPRGTSFLSLLDVVPTTRSLWPRALVCNTGRGGFDSHPRLSALYPRSSMEERQSTKLGPVKVRLLPWVCPTSSW